MRGSLLLHNLMMSQKGMVSMGHRGSNGEHIDTSLEMIIYL